MPVCAVCESEDFDERDGLYYCQTCMTQSQDYRREEEAEEGQTHNVLSQLTKKVQKEKKSPQVTKGRPWHTYEAFTIIIKEQVKALINLGASASLKDVVLRLWCNYLSKTGVAFPEDERKMDEFMRKNLRPRERYPASLDKPQVQPIRYRKTKYRNYGMSCKKAQRNIEKQNLASALESVEFHEGDNPLEQDDEEDSELEYSSQDDTFTKSELIEMKKEVEWMTMVKTLCFCYIGMLYTDNLVSVSDLVRWAGQNRIPYYRATKLLPEDMKFDSYDYRAFQTNLLKHEHMEADTKKLLRFLNLTDIPELPISAMISKLIVQLDLPGELHGFVCNLIKSEDERNVNNITALDLIAMAYIITTLQLLLGLDGSTERELSTIAVKLTSIFSNKYNMFVWSDWTTHIKKKINTSSLQDMFGNPRHCKDTKTFIENFVLFDKDKKSCNSRSKRDKTVRQETQDALLRPLETLQKKIQSSKGIDEIDNVDMDMEYNSGLEPTLAADVGIHLSSNTEDFTEKESTTLSEKFRSSSFKFITQPLSFKEDLDKTNLSMSAFKKSSIRDSEEEPNLSDVDLFESPPKKRKRQYIENDEDNISGDDQNNEELLILINRLSKIQEANVVIERRKQCKDLTYQSKTYQWLICMCASFLVCSSDLLHIKVMELQNNLFTNWNKSQWYRKKKVITLLKR